MSAATEEKTDARTRAREWWEKNWQTVIPLSAKPMQFVADEKAEADELHFRFDSPRAKSSWGFVADISKVRKSGRFPVDAPCPAYPKSLLQRSWLSPAQKAIIAPVFRRAVAGTYRLGVCHDHLVEVFLSSTHDDLRGKFSFAKGADGEWACTRTRDQAPSSWVDFPGTVQELNRAGVKLAFVPRDNLELSRGYRLIDIEKVARNLHPVAVIRKSDEQRYTLGVAYPAKDVDAHGEFMNAAELEKAAWEFIKTRGVGLMHQDGTDGAGHVVESYVYRGPDWEIEGQTVKNGDWLVGVVWEPEAWELIKAGKIRGYSMQGWASRKAK